MQFRAPKNFWEWVLLFSPALVIWAATAIWLAFPHYGEIGVLFVGSFYGSIAALVISSVAGHAFTKPNQQRSVRYSAVVLAAILIFTMNIGIAFAGCAVVWLR
jgi:hypothetical protein